jgi:hypothetical protein
VAFEGNRLASVGGADPSGACFGTVDIVTPLAREALAAARRHAAKAGAGPIGVGFGARAVRRPEGQGLGSAGDAARRLPRTLGLQPRNPAALAAGQAAAASNQAPLLRGSHGDDGAEKGDDNEDDDEQDDEGLWPGQLPPLSPPPRSSEAGAARAGRAADVTRWGDDCAGNCAETSARSGAEHESGGGAGMYLPLCPTACRRCACEELGSDAQSSSGTDLGILPFRLVVRHPAFSIELCVSSFCLFRYEPEIAMLAAAAGANGSARNVEMSDSYDEN